MSILYNKSSEEQEPKVARERAGQRTHEVHRREAGRRMHSVNTRLRKGETRVREKRKRQGRRKGRRERWEGNLLHLKRDIKDIPTNVRS